MTRGWRKMPNGRFLRQTPSQLALWLAECEPLSPALIVGDQGGPPAGTAVQRPAQSQGYHTESFDIRQLIGREVTAIGAGSVGSHAICSLGPAGLVINVIDVGTVQPKHTAGGRTAYDPTQIGLKKVYALKQKIERDYAGTIVNALPYNTAEIPDPEWKSLFRRSLVVLLIVDDAHEIIRLSDLAYPITELVQPAMHARGASGHIVVTVPFATPCLRCTLGVDDAAAIHRLDAEPATGMDIAAVAHQAARIALDIAYSKVTGRPICRWDAAKNLIYISNTKDELSQDGPGIHWEASRMRPGCPVCNFYAA
jgi:hypothetical protein